MNEILSIKEIEKEFDGEWVFIDEVEKDDRHQVKSGIVRGHSKNRDELHQLIMKLRPKRFAVFYIGELDPNFKYLL